MGGIGTPASVRQRQSLTQMSGAALVNVCVVA